MASSSWLNIAPDSDFGLANVPFGVFSVSETTPRCATALGDYVVDLSILAEAGLFDDIAHFSPRVFSQPTLNGFQAYPKPIWVAVRNRIIELFTKDGTSDALSSNEELQNTALHDMEKVQMHMPVTVGDYTDFYSSREHATNVGTMFRSKENALQPNWLHLPVGYHGRSSTVVLSGTQVRRPFGQLQKDKDDPKQGSVFGPCKLLDFELEMGFFVGGPENKLGDRLTVEQANDRIFGFCLLNDWSARDIQKWEYVPLGPFTAKNLCTSISPWIVTSMALEPFVGETSSKVQVNPKPLPYLQDPNYSSFDISLQVSIQGQDMDSPEPVCRSNFLNLYWNAVQQLVHHSVTGCIMRPGDLLGSGTISGSTPDSFGSMLELSWKGSRSVKLGEGGQVRKFLQDGDTVVMEGWCEKLGNGRVGFGSCIGTILPAVEHPVSNETETPSPRFAEFKLYNFWKSSSSWRVRIALEAKGIKYENLPVNLSSREHESAQYKARNPMCQVPVLECTELATGRTIRIAQSLAIVEFLDEAFPQLTPFFPIDCIDRAATREMIEIVNSGIQPLQNMPMLRDLEIRSEGRIKLKEEGTLRILRGLGALEELVKEKRNIGIYSLGGFRPTVADAFLVPQLYNATQVFGIDIKSQFPTLAAVEEQCSKHAWFANTHPTTQPGCDK